MRIIALKTLRTFWERHPAVRQPLQAWYYDVKRATWRTSTGVKDAYRNASFLGNHRIVFNIKGNQYCLVVVVNYEYGIVYIRFVGTHQEYDRIDAETI